VFLISEISFFKKFIVSNISSGSVLFINKVAELFIGFKSDEAKNLKFKKVFNIINTSYNSTKLLDETRTRGTVHKFKENLKIKSKKGSFITLEIKTSTGSDIDSNFITIFFWEKPKYKKRNSLNNFFVKDDFYQEDKINLMIIGNNSLLRKGILNVLKSVQSFDICCETTTKLEILECCYSKEIDLAIVLDDFSDPDEIFETINFLKNEISDIKNTMVYLQILAQDTRDFYEALEF